MNTLNAVIGTENVSPLAIAEAYATVANNGMYCQPQVIDRVTDSDGNELPKPERTCSPVLDPKVAATAAYALQGVMNGGTGAGGKPARQHAAHRQDGYPRRAPVVAGRVQHQGRDRDVGGQRPGRWRHLQDLAQRGAAAPTSATASRGTFRARPTPRTAATSSPSPDNDLIKVQLTDLPNVVGQTIEQATKTLTDAGFTVEVGGPVDSDQPAGVVGAQNPGRRQGRRWHAPSRSTPATVRASRSPTCRVARSRTPRRPSAARASATSATAPAPPTPVRAADARDRDQPRRRQRREPQHGDRRRLHRRRLRRRWRPRSWRRR